MVDHYEEFISIGAPFLKKERSQRATSLKSMINKADVTISEKFRRVFEAYQIEAAYGKEIESYPGELELEGKVRVVDLLRVGRIGLFYQTLDQSMMGFWSEQSNSWQALDSSSRLGIKKAIAIARKQAAPNLISLPIKKPEVL